MFPEEIVFELRDRGNYFAPNAEWALYVQVDGDIAWCLKTWDKKPTDAEYKEAVEYAMRCFEIYHKHIRIPQFNLKCI